MSAEDYLAKINEVLNRYGSLIESAAEEAKPAIYETALAELKELDVKPDFAAGWLRAKGYPPKGEIMNTDDIQGIVRHILTTAGGALVTSGVLTSGQLQDAIGAAMVLGGIVWSLYQKRQAANKLAAAKAA